MMKYWLEDFLEIGAILIGVMILFGVVLAAALGVIYTADRWQCATYAEVTGKETRFAALSCYVQTEDGWQVWEEYQTRALASEGLKAE